MGASAKVVREAENGGPLSEAMNQFVDHLAELLAEEFAAALKEERDAGSDLREVLEREPTRAEHRGSDPSLSGSSRAAAGSRFSTTTSTSMRRSRARSDRVQGSRL